MSLLRRSVPQGSAAVMQALSSSTVGWRSSGNGLPLMQSTICAATALGALPSSRAFSPSL